MNLTTNQFGQASPFSQQMSANNPPMLQGGQYTGAGAMTPMGQMPQGQMPGQQPNPMQSAQPGMTPQQKMMLVQMLQSMGNRQQMPQPMNLAGISGSTMPNNFLG